jgi:2-iminobutanoate/2-iminopropanoate deaminase
MPKEIIVTDKAPKPIGAYSQAVKAGGFVFVSTQGPADAATRELCGESIQDQTRQCLKNVEAILRAAGSSLDKVVSTTFTLAEIQDFAGMDEEWGKWFPTHPPAREGSVLPIPLKGMKIAVSAIAET